MKKSSLWILSLSAVVLLGAAGWQWRKSRVAAPALPAAQASAEAGLELAAADVLTLAPRRYVLGLPVSGALRATESAVVKARVAGELQNLTLREGDAVKAGQVLAQVDPTEYRARLRQAEQQADSARSQVDIAQKQFDNNQALVNQGFISKTALQTSQATLAGAQATHQAALAAVDVARKALEDTVIKAPISGQVSQRLAQPGERVAVDARVLELVNLSTLEMESAVPASDARQLRPGMTAQLQVEGMDAPVSAKVLRINPSTQAGSRQVLVYLGLPGQAGLRQGLYAEGQLSTRTVEALAVPLTSVRTDKPEPYVQVLEDDKVRHVRVKTGERSETEDQTWVLVEGLSAGSRVLLASAGALREGVRVRMGAPAAR